MLAFIKKILNVVVGPPWRCQTISREREQMEQKDAVLEGRKSRCCCMVDAIRYRRSFRLRTCVRSMRSREIVRVKSRRRLDQRLYHRSRSSTHVSVPHVGISLANWNIYNWPGYLRRDRVLFIYANTYFYENNLKNEISIGELIIFTEYHNEYCTLNLP